MMQPFSRSRFLLSANVLLLALFVCRCECSQTHAQSNNTAGNLESQASSNSQATNAEQKIAERYLQVLLRRPAPGTALDRVYGFHVQSGSLDELIQRLEQMAGEKSDSAAMLLGLIFAMQGDDDRAVQWIGQAERSREEDAMVSFFLGKSLLRIGRNQDAIEALKRAIDRKPSRMDAVKVYSELARLHTTVGNDGQALNVWQELEKQFPGDTRIMEEIAKTLADNQQYSESLLRYESLIRLTSDDDGNQNIGYRIAAAEIKRELGDGDSARSDLEWVLDHVRPSSWLYEDVRDRIESIYLASGDFSSLADYYLEQVKKNPSELELRMRLGRALSAAGRTGEAVKALRDATEMAPDHVPTRLAMIDALVQTDGVAEVSAQWESLVENDPGNPDFAKALGLSYLSDESKDRTERESKAEKAWLNLASERNDDPVILAQVASLMRRIGRDDKVVELLHQAISLTPQSTQYYEYLGEFYSETGRKQEALEAWRMIPQGDRGTIENWIRLAEILRSAKLSEEALAAMKKVETRDLTFSQRIRYAEFLEDEERFDESIKQLELARSIAETSDEKALEIDTRIGVYDSAGILAAKISQWERIALKSKRGEDFRTLALMHMAANQYTGATTAIELALKADSNDIETLTVAADLYREARFDERAIEVYRRLVKEDRRYRISHLKQIAKMQMEAGKIDEAIATGEELIAAQPQNPESFRFVSELCQRVGKTEDAIRWLRQSLSVAPSDRDSHLSLAKLLADAFRTQEAIAMHWQLMTGTQSMDQRVEQVAFLAPLYQRRGDLQRLTERLIEFGRQRRDKRMTAMLCAAAFEAVGDFAKAKKELTILLTDSSRDVELLSQLVELSMGANEVSDAVKYQQRLTTVADNPENRSRLVKLLYDSGLTEQAEALLRRELENQSPDVVLEWIDRAVARSDFDAAIKHCNHALSGNPSLWEIRSRLATLLTLTGQHKLAIAEIERIENLVLPDETPAVDLPSPAASAPLLQTNSGVPLEHNDFDVKIVVLATILNGMLLEQNSSMLLGSGRSPLAANNVRHAKYLALACRMAIAARSGRFDRVAEQLVPKTELETTTDVNQLWTAFHIAEMRPRMINQPPTMSDAERQDRLRWRIALHDVTMRNSVVASLLESLFHPNLNQDASSTIDPFTPDQIMVLAAYTNDLLAGENSPARSGTDGSYLRQALLHAGDRALADKVTEHFRKPKTPEDAIAALQFAQMDEAPRTKDQNGDSRSILKSQLIAEISSQMDRWAINLSPDQSLELLRLVGNRKLAMQDPKLESGRLELMIALQALRRLRFGVGSGAQRGRGTIYVNVDNPESKYRSLSITRFVPFSPKVLDPGFATLLESAFQFVDNKNQLAAAIIQLENGDESLYSSNEFADETARLKAIVCVYLKWWNDDFPGAYKNLCAISDAAPENAELWIERSRMAAALDKNSEALSALESIRVTTNQRVLRDKEMGRLNLAMKSGDIEKAREAARRLFAMRLDRNDENHLRSLLPKLELDELSRPILQRIKRRSGATANERLALAQKFLKEGDVDTAGEIAFETYKKLGTQRRSTAWALTVTLLRSTGRLDALITQKEKQLDSSPQSFKLRQELADLYRLANRGDDAVAVFAAIDAQRFGDPADAWEMAGKLVAGREYDRAINLFSAAIEARPSLLQQNLSLLYRAANNPQRVDRIYQVLGKIDTGSLTPEIFVRLIGPQQRRVKTYSEAARAALGKYLQRIDDVSFARFLQLSQGDIPLMILPEVRSKFVHVFSNPNSYQADSPIWTQLVPSESLGYSDGFLQLTRNALAQSKALTTAMETSIGKQIKLHPNNAMLKAIDLAMRSRNGGQDQLEPELQALLDNSSESIPVSLWWDLARSFESRRELVPLAIKCFLKVKAIRQSNGKQQSIVNDIRVGVDARLVQAYITLKRNDEARELILENYAAILSAGKATNTQGWNLREQALLLCAERFRLAKSNLDALAVYFAVLRSTTASWTTSGVSVNIPVYLTPGTTSAGYYSRVRNISGSNRTLAVNRQSIEREIQQTIKNCSDAELFKFLSVDSLKRDPNRRITQPYLGGFQILPLTTTPETSPQDSSFAAHAMYRVAARESTRRALRAFQERAMKLHQESPSDWRLACAATLSATVSHKPNESVDSALVCWSALRTIVDRSASGDGDPLDAEAFQSIQSVVLAGLWSPSNEIAVVASELAGVFIDLASENGHDQVAANLTSAQLHSAKRTQDESLISAILKRQFDHILSKLDPETTNGSVLGRACLEYAERCAEFGDWNHAMSALKHGFSNGPPMRPIATKSSANNNAAAGMAVPPRTVPPGAVINLNQISGTIVPPGNEPSNPFSVPQLSSRTSFLRSSAYTQIRNLSVPAQPTRVRTVGGVPVITSQTPTAPATPMIAQPRATVSSLSSKEVSKRVHDMISRMDSEIDESESGVARRRETASIIYDALVEMVFPSKSAKLTFPYTVSAISPSQSTQLKPPNLHPQNLSRIMARMAVISGRSDELAELIESRKAVTDEMQWVQLSAINLAIEKGDAGETESALFDLIKIMKLPVEVDLTLPKNPFHKSGREYTINATNANLMCQAVFPAHEAFGYTPAVGAIERSLVHWASKNTSLGVAEANWYWMLEQATLDQNQSDELVKWMLDNYLQSVRTSLRGTTPKDVERRIRARHGSLAKVALRAERFSLAGESLAIYTSALTPFDQSNKVVSEIAVDCADFTAEERYEIYSAWLFSQNFVSRGTDPGVSFRSVSCWNHYVVPPTALREATPHLKRVQAVPVASRTFPRVSNALLLAEAAAECGKTNEMLAKNLGGLDNSVEQTAMIGLSQLLAGNIREAEASIIAMKKDLDVIDKQSSPVVSATFVVRAAENDQLRSSVTELASHLLDRIRMSRNKTLEEAFRHWIEQLEPDPLAQIVNETDQPSNLNWMSGELPGWASTMLHDDFAFVPEKVNTARSSRRIPWYIDSEALKNLADTTRAINSPQRHIHRVLPMADGQSVKYRFFYRSGDVEVHPTIGRIAMLLRPDGVKLRWLLAVGSRECYQMDVDHEITAPNLIGLGLPDLREDQWNDVSLTRSGRSVTLTINEQPIVEVQCSDDMRFGLTTLRGGTAKVRDVRIATRGE